ncbi:vacuolar membrane-associated protein iml1, partial [Friedmanniomyces endolithicus]
KSDQLEIISLHYDRIHNPENCYHILLEWVNTTSILVREAVNRWTTLAETHGLKLVQVPCVEASKLHVHHPLEVPIPVNLALRPPEPILMTPVVDGQAVITPHVMAHSYAYQKALLRKLDFVLDFEAAASFPAKLEVLYSYGKPDYDMTQYIHKSGLLLAQVCVDDKCDFLLVPNRLAATRTSAAGKQSVGVDAVEHIVKRFVKFCQDEKALKMFYEQTKQPPPSPSVGNEFGMDNDVPPIQLPPRLAHRAVMRTVL